MTGQYVDLHNHTVYSDGVDNPAGIVRNAKMKGIDILAITDHDTMAGYEEARKEAELWNMKLIPGVEVSTEIYHILGLNVNPKDNEFQNFLGKVQEYQKEICRRRIKILQDYGVPISMEKLQNAFPKSRLGKYNIFMTMLRDPECNFYIEEKHADLSPDELFSFYLRNKGVAAKITGESGYVSSKEAIDAIHKAGGIAIIAHPFKEIKENVRETLDKLVEQGIDGLEVQPFYGDKNNEFRKYAEEKGLMISYGSDFHGASFYRPMMGRNGNLAGEKLVERLERIKEKPVMTGFLEIKMEEKNENK